MYDIVLEPSLKRSKNNSLSMFALFSEHYSISTSLLDNAFSDAYIICIWKPLFEL